MKSKKITVSTGLTAQYISKIAAFGLKEANKHCRVLSNDDVEGMFRELNKYPATRIYYFVATLDKELSCQKNHLELAHSQPDKDRRNDLKQALRAIKKAITTLQKFKEGGLEFPHPKDFSNTAQRMDAGYFQGMARQIAGKTIPGLKQLCETVEPYILTDKKRGRRFADEYNFVARYAFIYKEILGTAPASERNLFDGIVIASLKTLGLPHEAPARAIKKALEKTSD